MNMTKFSLSILLSILLLAPGSTRAEQPYFPDSIFFPEDQFLDDLARDQFSTHLTTFKEPSLWIISRKDRAAVSFRFLWLATAEKPICVRLTKNRSQFSLHILEHDRSPGEGVGKVTMDKVVPIEREQGDSLLRLIAKTPFWMAPVEVKESRGIADGDRILIEGVSNGKYHVIDRAGSTTKSAYKSFCRALLELANPDFLKAWDRHRNAEQRASDFPGDPTETLDDGQL